MVMPEWFFLGVVLAVVLARNQKNTNKKKELKKKAFSYSAT